mgnify:CR=1 FL=1
MFAVCTCWLPLLFFALAGDPSKPIPGQRPLLIIEGAFRFVSGSWAAYDIHDKAKKESYRMTVSILERAERKGKPMSWMEIDVAIPDSAGAVTRLLAVETPEGPGEIQEVIVQPRGYPPFRVPRKYFDGKGRDEEVGGVMPARVVKRMDFRRVQRGGREIQVIEVEAEDARGRPLKAQVSEEVAPIGVCRAENDGIRMELADWGTGAKTRIDGAPRSFYLWIFEQIGRGL